LNRGRPAGVGWRRLVVPSPYLMGNGPFRWRRAGSRLEMTLRLAPHHCGEDGFCHPGVYATFVDIVLGFGLGVALGIDRFLPTVGLGFEILGEATAGATLNATPEFTARADDVIFGNCVVRDAAGGALARGHASFKFTSRVPFGLSVAALFPEAATGRRPRPSGSARR